VVAASDHLVRGLVWPESVYGITNPEWWRFLEHAFWVLFEDIVLVMGVLDNLREMRTISSREAEMEQLHSRVESAVVERTRELEASREQYRGLLETTRTIPWQMDPQTWRFTYIGPQAASVLGCPTESWAAPGFFEERLHEDDREGTLERYRQVLAEGTHGEATFRLRRDEGGWVWVRSMISPPGERGSAIRGIMLDVTEQRLLELELRQAQKLESVGRLASGIAHEINTPIQFVSDSVHFLDEAFSETFPLFAKYRELRVAAVAGPVSPRLLAEVETVETNADIPYLMESVPKALDRVVDGIGRVATIVRSMKEFAHPDQREKVDADLNSALSNTLTIARNEYKYVADVETDFGEIPKVRCYLGELNQAFLNIIVNAAHAIGDVAKESGQKGLIKISTRRHGDQVRITIADTGGGIPEAIHGKVFDPFFTTKEVGKGTGQGLAIVRSVITEKHHGSVVFESKSGEGTTFVITLPIDGDAKPVAAKAA
ncbi:MAG: ATP-binding protein, partial [Candidatus Eisenbacteria bacterium]